MPKRSSTLPKLDINQIAANVVASVTGQDNVASAIQPEKNPAAVALGKLGGLKGGKARAAALSKKRRREIAIQAANSRWVKHDK